ncbi:GntR family transcriptional regulator [Sulfitobacter sp. D35]|uniref:GntR family transcriptional regulator n=1 Tax=Sulfitobacter sp. D35 TaxID=3083252 RepID=UPI00296F5106|nr:GntR family transcriptional regulator [Sulfitobacter sp. D35]MDW4497652.1 GntR family transcriptional regulator [Sulfitobacter sp. D35]
MRLDTITMGIMQESDAADLSQGELAYRRLNEAIRSGTFRPGDRLREVEVAARLDLSRTPVREAMRRLEADGVVEHRPRIGAVVRTLSHSELVELYEMRIVLERTAAGMAAKHASAAEADEMADINAELAGTAGDAQAAVALNERFHRCLYLGARNRFLSDAARGLNNALMLLGPTTLAGAARLAEVCEQHDAIVAAIRAGDMAEAGAAAERHLQTSLRARLKGVRE